MDPGAKKKAAGAAWGSIRPGPVSGLLTGPFLGGTFAQPLEAQVPDPIALHVIQHQDPPPVRLGEADGADMGKVLRAMKWLEK